MAFECCGEFHALPEDCIANALSLTTPKDVCRLSAVASTFLSASQSDAVWDRFLPSDIISRAAGYDSAIAKFSSKKELYLHLCDHPILIDAGRKSFSLEKLTGKRCYMLSARELDTVWSDTPEYWRWISLPESRFPEVAELLNVCWFEVTGRIKTEMLSSGTNYAAYLVFTSKSRLEGFESQTAEAFTAFDGHGSGRRKVCLVEEGEKQQRYSQIVARRRRSTISQQLSNMRRLVGDVSSGQGVEYPKKRSDGWMEVEMGEYFVEEEGSGELEMCVMEVNNGNWKSGLIIQGIEIRPKHVREN